MKFNVDKCKTMHLGHDNIKSEYQLDNKVLDSSHSDKDLGIWITDDMKLGYQTAEACKKANRCWDLSNGQSYTKIITSSLLSTSL